ncbi:MAG: C39 family peptidase [Oscillospiraceae bacterium]|jgi:hypothetical protein|nr:C39 family peptidase [Oscillospiraceae bacterium]
MTGARKIMSLILAAALLIPAAALAANELHTIPFPEDYEPWADGASSYENSGDHFDSPYFTHPDFYNMESTGTLTILTNFDTYQQTTEWSCGPVAMLMSLHYMGIDDYTEYQIAEMAAGLESGNNPEQMVRFLKAVGIPYETSPSGNGLPDEPVFQHGEEFIEWTLKNLSDGYPIMVDWIDWGAHWQVIIGYDTMGTESFGDDVMIVADPYDTSDHYQDGYMIYGAERFFYMWRAGYGNDTQPFVIAKPAK